MKIDKWILLIPVILSLVLILPMISAAVAVVVPTAGQNISGTFLVNCSYINGTDVTSPTSANTSFVFNGTGSEVLFVTRAGFTVTANAVYATVYSTEQTDGLGSVKCILGNSTVRGQANASSSQVRIDNTGPTTTLIRDVSTVSTRATETISWTSSDSGSGLSTVVTTVVSPDTTRCPTKTYTDTSSSATYLTSADTACSGTYTITMIATDRAGASTTKTETFKAYDAGLTKTGGNTLGGQVTSKFSNSNEINSQGGIRPLNDTGKNVALVILVIVIIYFFFLKKK